MSGELPISTTVRVRYSERLWPSVGVWIVGVGLALVAGLVFYPVGGTVGVGVATAVAVGIAVAVMAWWSPVVRVVDVQREGVTQPWLQAGNARIPLAALGGAVALDRSRWTTALGPGMDARSHRCVRGWVSTGMAVQVVDTRDPVPYWLVSCRRPDLVVAAFEAAGSSTRSP